MGLAQKLIVGHHHDHDSGGVTTHPRAYELFANAWFLGQRGRVFAPANCTFRAAGAEDLPFADASFDLIVSSLAAHHIPTEHRGDAVREMFRVLRPGGRLFIADVRPPAIPVLKTLIAAAIGRAMAHNITDELRELITEAGFTITGSGDVPLLRYISARRPERR